MAAGPATGGDRPSGTPAGGGRPPGAGGRVGPPRSGGSAGAWLGGLVGGLIGGALAWLILAWVLPPPLQPEFQLLQLRVDEIGEAITGAESGNAQLAELATRIEALESGPDTGLLGRIDALEAQLDQAQDLNARLSQLESAGGAGLPPDLEERLAAIESAGQQQAGVIQRLAEAERPPAAELVARIEALEQSIGSGQAGGAAGAELDQRLAALEADLAALAAAGGGGGQAGAEASATMSQIREQLNALQSEVGTLRSEGTADRLAALDQRLASAEESGGAVTALEDAVGQLQNQLQEVAAATGQLSETVPDDLGSTIENVSSNVSAVQDRVQTLANTLDSVQQQVGTVSEQMGELQERVGSTEEALESAAARRDQAAALALATAQIDGALQQAAAFEKPLQTIQALAAEDQVVADASSTLQPMAAAGVPTRAKLRNDFEQIADDIVHSSRSEGDGIIDQAANNLMSLVTVRPVGAEVEGDDPAARVARAEAKLREGNLEGAVAELDGLEGPAQAAAQSWLEQARARLAAEQAVATLQNHATGLLGQTN